MLPAAVSKTVSRRFEPCRPCRPRYDSKPASAGLLSSKRVVDPEDGDARHDRLHSSRIADTLEIEVVCVYPGAHRHDEVVRLGLVELNVRVPASQDHWFPIWVFPSWSPPEMNPLAGPLVVLNVDSKVKMA